ncbi:MAG: phosphatidylglycerol lysyltransferase domain-containing protein [Phenylobacterium sp.]
MAADSRAPAFLRPSRLWDRLSELALDFTPMVFAVLAFAAGAVMLVSSAAPTLVSRLGALTRLMPILVVELSHFLGSVVAFLLLLIAGGLWRRQRGAYWAALTLLLGGAMFSLLRRAPAEEPLLLVGVSLMLAPCRSAFRRRSRLTAGGLGPVWLTAIALTLAAAAWLGLFAYRDVPYTDQLWWTFLRDADVSRFLRAAAAIAVLSLLLGPYLLLSRPPGRWRGRPSPDAVAQTAEVFAQAQDAPTLAALAQTGDKDLLFSASGRSFLAFGVRGARFVALAGPAGDPAERRELLWSFLELADREGRGAVLYGFGDELLPDVAGLGMTARKAGETAAVDLAGFSLTGKARQDLRTARNRAQREGAVFEVLPPGAASRCGAELRAVSDLWLARQGGQEKGFSLGRFDLAYLDRGPVAVVRKAGEVAAFANLLTNRARGEISIDLMRYGQAEGFLMDFLFAEAMTWAQGEGFATFDLGMAPLAGLDTHELAPLFARLGALVFEEGGPLYGFQGVRAYKAKFGPAWKPVYIAVTPGVPMFSALLDVALLTSGGWAGMLGVKGR